MYVGSLKALSRCTSIRNQFFFDPDGQNTYCCESVPPGTPERKQFKLTDWDAKRAYELDLYEQSKQGWLTECLLCKYNEDKFGESMRTRANDDHDEYNNDHIQSAIIKTSNHCNMACRMCEPSLSTLWQKVVRDNPNKEFMDDTYQLDEPTDDELEILKEKVFTGHLRNLVFSGGESLLSKKNYLIIEHLLETGHCKNISLHITTNGSVKIKDAWLDASKHFHQFSMEFSIDGGGDVYEYIRPGSSWDTLVDVIDYTKRVAPNTKWLFNYVAQALNAHHMDNDERMIMQLFDGVEINDPDWIDHLSICHNAPEDSYVVVHPELRAKYDINYYADDFEYCEETYAKFMRKMAWLDKAHGTSLKKLNPDFFDTSLYPQSAINVYDKYIETGIWTKL